MESRIPLSKAREALTASKLPADVPTPGKRDGGPRSESRSSLDAYLENECQIAEVVMGLKPLSSLNDAQLARIQRVFLRPREDTLHTQQQQQQQQQQQTRGSRACSTSSSEEEECSSFDEASLEGSAVSVESSLHLAACDEETPLGQSITPGSVAEVVQGDCFTEDTATGTTVCSEGYSSLYYKQQQQCVQAQKAGSLRSSGARKPAAIGYLQRYLRHSKAVAGKPLSSAPGDELRGGCRVADAMLQQLPHSRPTHSHILQPELTTHCNSYDQC